MADNSKITKKQLNAAMTKVKKYTDSLGGGGTGGTEISVGSIINSSISAQRSQYNAKPVRPLITFTDDDGKIGVYTKLKPIIESKGVPYTFCIITSMVGKDGYLTWEQIKEMQDSYGCEIMSHTDTHRNISTFDTNKEWIEELKVSKEKLIEHGLNVRGLAYPGGGFYGTKEGLTEGTTDGHWMTGLFYDYAMITQGNNNTYPMKTNLGIDRVALGSYGNSDTDTLETLKAMVDEAKANNRWLIFMTHVDDVKHTDEDTQNISDLIDYIKSVNVDIVTPSEGFEIFGNSIETPKCKITKQGDCEMDLSLTIPNATKDSYGQVKIGDGLSISDGIVSVDSSSYYTKTYLDEILDKLTNDVNNLKNNGGSGGSGDVSEGPTMGVVSNITNSPYTNYTLTYTASDASGISMHELSTDSGSTYEEIRVTDNGDGSFTYSGSITNEGVYYCKIRLTNGNGKTTIRSFSITIKSEKIYLKGTLTQNAAEIVDIDNGIFKITHTSGKYDVLKLYDSEAKLEINSQYRIKLQILEDTINDNSIIQCGSTWDIIHTNEFPILLAELQNPTQEVVSESVTIYGLPEAENKPLIYIQLKNTTNDETGYIKFKLWLEK